MEPWRDLRTRQPKVLGDVWTLTKKGRRAICILVGHPLGTEARVVIDGEVYRTEAFRDSKAMVDATWKWRQAFEEKGWEASSK